MLRATCSRFFNLVPRSTLHDLLEFEISQFCCDQLLYVCTICVRLRHLYRFADDKLPLSRGYIGPDTFKKFCLDCGLSYNRYPPGSVVAIRGIELVVCWKCKKVEPRDRIGSAKYNCKYQVECDACWSLYEPFRRELSEWVHGYWKTHGQQAHVAADVRDDTPDESFFLSTLARLTYENMIEDYLY